MKTTPLDLLIAMGVPQGAIQRLFADPEAILSLGDFSISLLEDEVLCFDHAVPLVDPYVVADHLDYFKSAIAAFVEAGHPWTFIDDEPQRVAVMSFEVESDEIVA